MDNTGITWYSLTLLSSSSSYNLDMHIVYDDIVFATLLSLYSYIVDPLLGGLIGCTHVMVGLTASIIGNSQLGNMIGRLGDVRYRKLHNENDANDANDDDGSSLAYVDPTKRPFRLPMAISRSTEKNGITYHKQVCGYIRLYITSYCIIPTFPRIVHAWYYIGIIMVKVLLS